jgi:hypothetical protein
VFIGSLHGISAASLARCAFESNRASHAGALAVRAGLSAEVSVRTEACTFVHNEATEKGAAVLAGGQWGSLGDVFEDGERDDPGPVIHVVGNGEVDIIDVTFRVNLYVEDRPSAHDIHLAHGAMMRCIAAPDSIVPVTEGRGRGGCQPADDEDALPSRQNPARPQVRHPANTTSSNEGIKKERSLSLSSHTSQIRCLSGLKSLKVPSSSYAQPNGNAFKHPLISTYPDTILSTNTRPYASTVPAAYQRTNQFANYSAHDGKPHLDLQ